MTALIYSHQRCGSSNTYRFAKTFLAERCDGMEKFSPARLNKEAPDWDAYTYQQLGDYFDDVLQRTPLVKHIYGSHSADVDSLLLTNRHLTGTVLLRRENLHAAALSALIARRTKKWNESATEPLGRISPRHVRERAGQYERSAQLAERMCRRAGVPLITVSYEEFFSPDTAERKHQAGRVVDFLFDGRVTPSQEEFELAFEQHLAPSKKLNSAETVNLVQNIDELRATFPEILD